MKRAKDAEAAASEGGPEEVEGGEEEEEEDGLGPHGACKSHQRFL